jgi:hypothetical protein
MRSSSSTRSQLGWHLQGFVRSGYISSRACPCQPFGMLTCLFPTSSLLPGRTTFPDISLRSIVKSVPASRSCCAKTTTTHNSRPVLLCSLVQAVLQFGVMHCWVAAQKFDTNKSWSKPACDVVGSCAFIARRAIPDLVGIPSRYGSVCTLPLSSSVNPLYKSPNACPCGTAC